MKYLLSLLALPLLAQPGVTVGSAEKERALGQHCVEEVRKQARPSGIPTVDAYVTRVGSTLAAHSNDPSREYRFEVISADTWSEPFAVLGGTVFVPVRALAVAQDEAEFVRMLAHAIGHVELRHGMRTVAQGSGNTASIPLVFMSPCQGAHANTRAPQTTVPLAVRQSWETNELGADQFARQLTARAGYDLQAVQQHTERTPSGEDFRNAQQLLRSSIERQPPCRIPTLRR